MVVVGMRLPVWAAVKAADQQRFGTAARNWDEVARGGGE